MKKLYIALFLTFAGSFLIAQQGPNKDSSDTVARPRKKEDKLPDGPSFKSDVTAVSVDVAVLDNKGHFIPNIPRGNFRILEDNVPQQVSGYSMGEAPITIAMVIEFSNRYQ